MEQTEKDLVHLEVEAYKARPLDINWDDVQIFIPTLQGGVKLKAKVVWIWKDRSKQEDSGDS